VRVTAEPRERSKLLLRLHGLSLVKLA